MQTYGPFVLAAASGLAFLAYNHPDFYRQLAYVLTGIIIAVYVLAGAWSFGVMRAAREVIGFPRNSLGEDPYDKIKKLELPLGPFMAAYIATLGYVWLLTLLPAK